MYLYYFNSITTVPLKFIIVRILNDDEYEELLDKMTDIFHLLIKNYCNFILFII